LSGITDFWIGACLQMIPLYAMQDATTIAGAGGDTHSASSVSTQGGELVAPELLMRFPPLAYLLNGLLTQMNYLRECPLVTTEQRAMECVLQLFRDICAHLVDKAAEVRKLGEKYLSAPLRGSANKRTAGKSQEGEGATMDRLYAQAIAQELLPHVLVCFETIYSPGGSRLESKLRAVKARDVRRSAGGRSTGALQCLVSTLYDARDVFGTESTGHLEAVWTVLVRGGLLTEDALSTAAPAPPVVPASAPVPAVTSASNANAGSAPPSAGTAEEEGVAPNPSGAADFAEDASKDD
jgi:hypothetical protein